MAVDVGSGYVYLTRGRFINAWGNARMEGTMFDTAEGTVQVNVWFEGPDFATEDDMLNAILRSEVP